MKYIASQETDINEIWNIDNFIKNLRDNNNFIKNYIQHWKITATLLTSRNKLLKYVITR